MAEMTPADISAVTRNEEYGYGGGMWIFALLILLMVGRGGLFGDGMNGRVATVEDLNNSANFTRLEASVTGLGQMMTSQNSDLNARITNLGNGLCELGYRTQGDFYAVQQAVLESRYLNEKAIADSNAGITAQITALSSKIDQNKIESLQQQVNQLQLQNAMCGVVRYPNGMTYSAGPSPFCGCNGYGY